MKIFSLVPRKLWPMIFFATLAGIASGAFSVAMVATINNGLHAGGDASRLLPRFFGQLTLWLVFRRIGSTLISRVGFGLTQQVRTRIATSLLRAPIATIERIGTARLNTAITEDVAVIAMGLSGIPGAAAGITVCVALLIYIGILSWKCLVAILGVAALVVLAYTVLLGLAAKQNRPYFAQRNELFRSLHAVVFGAKELRTQRERRADLLKNEIDRGGRRLVRLAVSHDEAASLAGDLASAAFFISAALGVMYAGRSFAISDVARSGTALAVLSMSTPAAVLARWVPEFGRARFMAATLDSLEILRNFPTEEASSREPKKSFETLELRGLVHSYPGEIEGSLFRLGPIDLTLRPGTLTFIVGGNGSGKTTLAKLATGMYTPEGGDLVFDGDVIDDGNRDWFRQHVSVVFTDFHLFRKVTMNASPDVQAKAREYLVKLRLDHKVTITDGVLSTTDLSTGQRKRLALLASFLEDKLIYLFDEWAADQDPRFRAVFYTELLPELRSRGKCVVAITHDDRFFPLADEVVKLDNGRISDEATSQFMWRMTS